MSCCLKKIILNGVFKKSSLLFLLSKKILFFFYWIVSFNYYYKKVTYWGILLLKTYLWKSFYKVSLFRYLKKYNSRIEAFCSLLPNYGKNLSFYIKKCNFVHISFIQMNIAKKTESHTEKSCFCVSIVKFFTIRTAFL